MPDLGETKLLSGSSSGPRIRPGHHDPFLLRTQTKPPTDASMPLLLASTELPISQNRNREEKKKKKKFIQKPISTYHFLAHLNLLKYHKLSPTRKCTSSLFLTEQENKAKVTQITILHAI